MQEHCAQAEIKRFAVSALPAVKMDEVANHLADCTTCHQVLADRLKGQKTSDGLQLSLDPVSLFRHDHLDYKQLVAVADHKLDADEQEITNLHLSDCARCREDVSSLLAFRKEIEPELRVRYGPSAGKPTEAPVAPPQPWTQWLWKPAYVVAMVVIAIGLLLAVLYTRRKTENLEARQTPPNVNTSATTTPTPETHVGNYLPSPPPVPPKESPLLAPSPALVVRNRETVGTSPNPASVSVLNDGSARVTIDKTGNVTGLDQLPPDLRREIAEVVITQSIPTPEILNELAGTPINLRGSDEAPKFKLRLPARTVILSDRPSFQWEALPAATSYQVSVGDLNGHEVARSEQLSSDRTSWTPHLPLKRGEIYVWEVEAIVDGKKVLSPGTSETQMKFKILPDESARKLEELKKGNSRLALGVFYAHQGMLSEAEREFGLLIRENPRSPLLKKLLVQIRSR